MPVVVLYLKYTKLDRAAFSKSRTRGTQGRSRQIMSNTAALPFSPIKGVAKCKAVSSGFSGIPSISPYRTLKALHSGLSPSATDRSRTIVLKCRIVATRRFLNWTNEEKINRWSIHFAECRLRLTMQRNLEVFVRRGSMKCPPSDTEGFPPVDHIPFVSRGALSPHT